MRLIHNLRSSSFRFCRESTVTFGRKRIIETNIALFLHLRPKPRCRWKFAIEKKHRSISTDRYFTYRCVAKHFTMLILIERDLHCWPAVWRIRDIRANVFKTNATDGWQRLYITEIFSKREPFDSDHKNDEMNKFLLKCIFYDLWFYDVWLICRGIEGCFQDCHSAITKIYHTVNPHLTWPLSCAGPTFAALRYHHNMPSYNLELFIIFGETIHAALWVNPKFGWVSYNAIGFHQ